MKFERYGIGLAKGLSVTLKTFFRHPITTQYPKQKLHTSRRIRGNEHVWDEIKCTGCGSCAKACPQGAIRIQTSTNMVDNKYEVENYEIDTGYCIHCGLCIEACPYGALYMGYSYECARYRRGELIHNKEEMALKDKRPSGYFYPEVAAELPEQTLLVEKIVEDKWE